MSNLRFPILLYFLLAIFLFVYSYGFTDLNLTLSSHPVLFDFVSSMQRLVYFDRALSLRIFIGLITLGFFAYSLTLAVIHKSKNPSFPWKSVVLISLILALAYPMLSSDVFKYLFGAKQILLYGSNPYLVTPDTFGDDTWIRFMRWVHTTSPYGPVFIGLTIPYYLLSFGKFVPMLYLFKLDQVAWYLVSIYLIGKITGSLKWSPKSTVLAQLFFAFNPLVLMEWLVNAHNDAIMITLLLLSIYLFQQGRQSWSLLSLIFSVGVKYITVVFLPVLILARFIRLRFDHIIYYLLLTLAAAPLLYHYSWQYQPWYVTWLIPLAALIPNLYIRTAVASYSLSVFSRYYFFVGTGSWGGTPTWHALMTFTPPVLVLTSGSIWYLIKAWKTKR